MTRVPRVPLMPPPSPSALRRHTQEGHFLLLPAMQERQNRRAQELLSQDCLDMAWLALQLPSYCVNFNSPGAGAPALRVSLSLARPLVAFPSSDWSSRGRGNRARRPGQGRRVRQPGHCVCSRLELARCCGCPGRAFEASTELRKPVEAKGEEEDAGGCGVRAAQRQSTCWCQLTRARWRRRHAEPHPPSRLEARLPIRSRASRGPRDGGRGELAHRFDSSARARFFWLVRDMPAS